MLMSNQNEKKNILDFQFFMFRKKLKIQEINNLNFQNKSISSIKMGKSLDDFEISTKIKKIKESVQRINKIISELKQIADNPNK